MTRTRTRIYYYIYSILFSFSFLLQFPIVSLLGVFLVTFASLSVDSLLNSPCGKGEERGAGSSRGRVWFRGLSAHRSGPKGSFGGPAYPNTTFRHHFLKSVVKQRRKLCGSSTAQMACVLLTNSILGWVER